MALTVVVIASRRSSTANAEPAVTDDRRGPFFSLSDNRTLRAQLTSTQGELTLVKAQFERADKIIYYSTHYGINAGLAAKVFDASVREGVDPELAFRLVRLESEFNPRAVSKVGALGLTQLMNNTTTARDLAVLLEAIETGRAASRSSCDAMREILLHQEFNEEIPAGLPAGTRVAHKTGWITGVLHDAAVVYPPGRKPYVLVVLTRDIPDEKVARRLIADLSRIVWAHAVPGRVATGQ